MNHRHLLPNEIDLLVDGDAGFGVAPLRAHLAECGDCRARYDELRIVAEAVDALPHFTPNLRFADGIMAQVQIVEPWHVAATESARRLIPTSTPMRVLVGAGAGLAAVTISGSAAWLAFRGDLAGWVVGLFLDRTRQTLVTGAGEVAAGALGADATTTLASGGLATLAITSAVLAVAATGAVLGFRRLAVTARANRS
ncbi:MAG: hypothetical protein IPJ78_16190 [Gemmatimonadetes bacterium]|nr:hypothetical protein [Gemmatimonadota bacterium]MBP7548980.1 hypothetical protein [Gemmatimonadaceae bacterium]